MADADAQLDETAERMACAGESRPTTAAVGKPRNRTRSSRRSWPRRGPQSRRGGGTKPSGWPRLERAAARRAAFAAICERVDALRGEDTPDEIEKARAEWEGMPGASAQEREDAELRARFDESCRRATERHQNRQAHREGSHQARRAVARGRPAVDAGRQHARGPRARCGLARGRRRMAVARRRRPTAIDESDRRQVCRSHGPGPAPRRRKARRRRTDAEAAGAARRTVDRARHGARGRRGSDPARGRPRRPRSEDRRRTTPPPVERTRAARAGRTAQGRAGRDGAAPPRPARDGRVEAVRQRRRPGRADRQGRGAAREVLARRHRPKTKPDGSTEVTPAKPEDIEKAAHELHEIQERWKQVAEAPRAQAQALVAPLSAGCRPDPGQGTRVLRAARRGAQRQPHASRWPSSSAPRRSPSPRTGSRRPTN